MAVVERVRDSQDGAQLPHDVLLGGRELAEGQVFGARMRFSMISRNVCDQIEFDWIERTGARALNQIVRVFVMLRVRDEEADVMKHGRGVQDRGVSLGKFMQRTKLIKQVQ